MPTNKKAGWIDKVVSDPANPPRVIAVQGYLGNAEREGHVRVYLNPHLTDYVDAPEAAILHSEESTDATLPPGAMWIWLDRDVDVVHPAPEAPKPQAAQARQAKFLEGRLAQSYARRTAAAQTGQAQGALGWQSEIDGCPSRLEWCPTREFICPPSRFTICVSTPSVCCSPVDGCITRVDEWCPIITETPACNIVSYGTGCPSPIDGCPTRVREWCPVITETPGCNIVSRPIICESRIGCGSWVDGCESAFCGTDTDVLTDTVWQRRGGWQRGGWGRGIGGTRLRR